MTQAGPLAGIRVIEVCHILAGPYCGMLLADLGADVIKVETGSGDIARSTGNHEIDGHNTYFASLNRNKRSVLLDIADPHRRGQNPGPAGPLEPAPGQAQHQVPG